MDADYSSPPDETVEDTIERAQAEGVDPLTSFDTEEALSNASDVDLIRTEDDALDRKRSQDD
jgi:hypothetical protein